MPTLALILTMHAAFASSNMYRPQGGSQMIGDATSCMHAGLHLRCCCEEEAAPRSTQERRLAHQVHHPPPNPGQCPRTEGAQHSLKPWIDSSCHFCAALALSGVGGAHLVWCSVGPLQITRLVSTRTDVAVSAALCQAFSSHIIVKCSMSNDPRGILAVAARI